MATSTTKLNDGWSIVDSFVAAVMLALAAFIGFDILGNTDRKAEQETITQSYRDVDAGIRMEIDNAPPVKVIVHDWQQRFGGKFQADAFCQSLGFTVPAGVAQTPATETYMDEQWIKLSNVGSGVIEIQHDAIYNYIQNEPNIEPACLDNYNDFENNYKIEQAFYGDASRSFHPMPGGNEIIGLLERQ
jgi:hypothetical protein